MFSNSTLILVCIVTAMNVNERRFELLRHLVIIEYLGSSSFPVDSGGA